MDVFKVPELMEKELGDALMAIKAAELMDLVDTPHHRVLLTRLGQQVADGDVNERKRVVRGQLKSLKLVQMLIHLLENQPETELPYDQLIDWVQSKVPALNPKTSLDTLIDWGRYGEIFRFNSDTAILSLDAETSKLGVIHHAEHSSKNRHITVAYDPRVLPSGQLTHLLATQPADVWQAYLQAVFGTTDTLKDIVGVFVESCKVAVADIYVHLPTIQDTQTWEAWHISSVRALSFNYYSGTEKVVINGVTNAQANKGRSWAVEGGA